MTYIDMMIAPLHAGRKDDYLSQSRDSAKLFLEYGAIHVMDTHGVDVPEGKQTDLWRAVAADKAAGETIACGWIVWPSKAARDEAWGRLMADERMKPEPDMPFDPRRMIFGGFETLLDSRKD